MTATPDSLCSQSIGELFSSAISIKILLLLSLKGQHAAEFCTQTGHAAAAVLPKIQQLEERALVSRTNRSYTLTPLGGVLAKKIAALFHIEAGDLAVESPGDEMSSAVLDLYARHAREINLIVRSGIRTRIALALLNGVTERDLLREEVGCRSSNFRTNIRTMIDAGMVSEETEGVRLTPQGSRIASAVADISELYCLILKHRDFWRDHELQNLPDFALDSLGELIESEMIQDSPLDYFRTYDHYLGIIAGARHIHGISSMTNPGVADAIGAKAVAGVPVELVISPELALHLHREPYKKKVESLFTYPHFQFYVTREPLPLGLTVTDAYLSMKLFFVGTTSYDLQRGFFSTSPRARAWGERLFDHYKKRSIPLEEYL
jgi:predicted transcriptional regulator